MVPDPPGCMVDHRVKIKVSLHEKLEISEFATGSSPS
jgi:hypothetical protein